MQRHSALKVVKSAGRYAETARDEIKLLTHVSSFSPSHPGRQHVVSFFDSFSHHGPESSHVCIVFEPLGENLLALIERHKKKGVPKALVKVITKQVLLGLQYLHDECDLVHTDIKPENICEYTWVSVFTCDAPLALSSASCLIRLYIIADPMSFSSILVISIPDIEAHIYNELAQASSPTSRRVGVPYPTKSRAGMSIPHNPSRVRRQVQIFNSQPLSSPRRSWNRGVNQSSVGGCLTGNESGGNSLPGSYLAQMHISRLAGSVSVPHCGPSGTVASHNSSIPKVSSGLSSYSTCAGGVVRRTEKKPSVVSKLPKASEPPGRLDVVSPSMSSSSSSFTLASTAVGPSSMTSTPPTSLSNSIGNVVAGFFSLAKVATEVNSRLAGSSQLEHDNQSGIDHIASPVQRVKKEREAPENDLQNAAAPSWKFHLGLSSSWKERVSSSFASFRSTASADTKPQSTAGPVNHIRQSNGISSSSFWKDPGTAPLAPAVVVSAIARADGSQDTNFILPLPNVPLTKKEETAASGSSSVTATPAWPSPIGTPSPMESKMVRSDVISSVTQPVSARAVTGAKRTLPRPSPPKQISQLSAHMHTHHPPSSGQCECFGHQPRRTIKSRTLARILQSPNPTHTPISDTSIPAALTPSTPPPTPVASPTSHSFPFSRGLDRGSLPPGYIVPPISVKIADLGNATPSTKHFTEDIQTRQYRAPEAIIGRRDWNARADIWSVACMVGNNCNHFRLQLIGYVGLRASDSRVSFRSPRSRRTLHKR